ncbi:molybdate transport system ATP-binding protein [Xanthobacter sp. SG618]|uniref:molybdenum ABC transporter ATP-binding protein n=1 Tax=Xanthobacter sp. SG618 TaxID=2587121 RepID=UPI00145ED0ED|nr:molybdenum ABC transporter ATP-binding protein [Xanthobacter sp. SG618]NMN58336.1 molybdate transport system ATP-binding protein [Xanthobacter sp. SG618]
MIEIDVSLARSTGFHLKANLRAPETGVTALFGRSGCGKTTVIQLVAGSLTPDSGHIRVGDTVFYDRQAGINLPMEQRAVGYVFQDARLFPHMTIENNLRYGERRTKRPRTIQFDAVVEMLGVGHLLKRRPHTLSGGEKQRIAIGRALLSQPRLLLMDEPLASLDEMRKGEILPYLERLRDELSLPILYVSHSIEEVLRLADAVAALSDGKVIACGPLSDVLSRPELLPVIGRFDIGTILDCTVTAHDPDLGLSTVSFADGELRVPLVGRPVGAPARARIRSRDVSLSLSRPMDVSVTNRISGTISAITRAEGPFSEVELALSAGRLSSLVTQESVLRLGLEPGMQVWAMIKAVTVDSRPPGFHSPGAEFVSPPVSRPARPAANPPQDPPALRVISGGSPPKGQT